MASFEMFTATSMFLKIALFCRRVLLKNKIFAFFPTIFKFFNIIRKGKKETYFISCIIGWTHLRKKLLSIHWKEFRKTVHQNIRGKIFFLFYVGNKVEVFLIWYFLFFNLARLSSNLHSLFPEVLYFIFLFSAFRIYSAKKSVPTQLDAIVYWKE